MENVQSALALALIAERSFVIQTDQFATCVDRLKELAHTQFGIDDVVQIDLKKACEDGTYDEVVDRMVLPDGTSLHQIVIWKNLEALDTRKFKCKTSIMKILNELEQYDTLASRSNKGGKFTFGKYQVTKPPFFAVIPVIQLSAKPAQIHQHIKNRFWFSQSYFTGQKLGRLRQTSAEDIMEARLRLGKVYANPTIQEYISSLLVFTRTHRLCSLAPLTTRPSLWALDGIMTLAKALVVWNGKEYMLFVTPEYIKVAYRKVGYWLVDWETNGLFKNDEEYRKQIEISMLTGDWYGSEWKYVEDYLDKHASVEDKDLATGFTNQIVEEVLALVMPPM